MRLTPGDIKHELVAVESLRTHPRNPRRGDRAFVGESVSQHGVFRSVVVSSDSYVLAGNHTYLAACDEGEDEIWIGRVPLDHDDPQAIQIMTIDNRAADRATYDDQALVGVLSDLLEQDRLDGSGYSEGDLSALIDALREPEPTPDPEPGAGRKECPKCGHVWYPG